MWKTENLHLPSTVSTASAPFASLHAQANGKGDNPMSRFCTRFLLLFLSAFISSSVTAGFRIPFFSTYAPVEVAVMDTFAEVRTGPGRGYPVIHTVEQGERIELITQRPGWYEIQSVSGHKGWTSAREISRTIQATGEPADLPNVGYGDYINRRWWTGFSGGRFLSGDFDSFDVITLVAGYRFNQWISGGLEHGRAYGSDTTGRQYGGIFIVEPFSSWRLSPTVSLGVGRLALDNQPRQVTFDAADANYYSVGFGAAYYLGRRFVAKAEGRYYYAEADENSDNMFSLDFGFTTFF